jgi:quercetin dioxygenase-like cupin family protein
MKRVEYTLPMKGITMSHLRASCALIALVGFMAQLSAAGAQDLPGRKELKRTDLSGAPGMEVVTSIVEFKPGETIPRHSHHGVESAYVIQGATLQSPGKPSRTVPTGASLQNLRDAVHGGDKIIGATSFKLFTVHVVDKGKPLFEPAAR